MIDEPPKGGCHESWRWQVRNTIKSVDALAKYLPEWEVSLLKALDRDLHISITPHYASLIHWDDPNDPIRLQCVPSIKEYDSNSVGAEDPLHEDEQSPVMDGEKVVGLVHRYPDRVLIISTDICRTNCRACTRRRLWDDGGIIRTQWEFERILEYIRRTPDVRDVILSGGDPLTLPLPTLDYILTELRKIDSVEMIRIGTRFPVVLPQRFFDNDILDVLKKHAPLWINTQFNHSREVSPESAIACLNILKCGCQMNNQCVLLKGINDSVEEMTALSHALLKIGVRPYYMFLPDRVRGTEHFWTDVDKGIEIIKGMRGFTSGLGIPQFVVDAEGLGKIPLNPDYTVENFYGYLTLVNYEGKRYHISTV